jgi:hypothetical protein
MKVETAITPLRYRWVDAVPAGDEMSEVGIGGGIGEEVTDPCDAGGGFV